MMRQIMVSHIVARRGAQPWPTAPAAPVAPHGRSAPARASILAIGVLLLLRCFGPATALGGSLARQDILRLDRVTYGPTTAVVDEYLKLGRRRFLSEQLHPADTRLPPTAAAQIGALEISHSNAAAFLATVSQEQQRINALPDEAARQVQRKALNDRGSRLAYEAARREILRALYSPAQLQEQLTWLWLDHFSLFQYKANDAWLVADYADTAVRPHALGHFRDLV